MILLNVLILGTLISCTKGHNITLSVPQIQTISESELVELKLPKGVKREILVGIKLKMKLRF